MHGVVVRDYVKESSGWVTFNISFKAIVSTATPQCYGHRSGE